MREVYFDSKWINNGKENSQAQRLQTSYSSELVLWEVIDFAGFFCLLETIPSQLDGANIYRGLIVVIFKKKTSEFYRQTKKKSYQS